MAKLITDFIFASKSDHILFRALVLLKAATRCVL